MTAELGHFALIIACLAGLVQIVAALFGASRLDRPLMETAGRAAYVQLAGIVFAFFALMLAYVQSDFSLRNVAENSHTLKPWLYKVTGVWGNHEGSMLLWALILALFGAAVAGFGARLRPEFRARVLSVQGAIGFTFLAFILWTSNPFARLDPAPFEGESLNPLLQDPGLAFHPPMLYAGYVGLSVAFSFAIAALMEGKVDAAWARWVRPWTLAAWIALTMGIAMGSWWAYYELGWGGWWAWDPVENASFIPWLLATALLHSVVVVERRESLRAWAVLLAILAFSASLLGTFLVRSGVLTSVHAFATDPTRGVFILGILAFFIAGALILYAWRAPAIEQGGFFAPVSRESALLLNNIVLSVAAISVLMATLYPLLYEAVTGQSLSVGPQVYDSFFPPIMGVGLALLPVGAALAWKRGNLVRIGRALLPALAQMLLVIGTVLAFFGLPDWAAALAIGVGWWMIAGTVTELERRTRSEAAGSAQWLRLTGLPLSYWGMVAAHIGAGILVIGAAGASAWSREGSAVMRTGETATIAGYSIRLDRLDTNIPGPNYRIERADMTLLSEGNEVAVLRPERRSFPARGMTTTEAAIITNGLRDLYVVIGEGGEGGSIVVRVFFKPLVPLIWIGAIMMALGGALSLSSRRFRLGISARPSRLAAITGV